MSKSNGFIAVMTLIASLIIIFYGASVISFEPTTEKAAGPVIQKKDFPTVDFADPIRGNSEAKLTVVEFGNYGCSACVALDYTIRQYLINKPEQVRFAWKDVITSKETPPYQAAVAARCAREQGKFWEYHDRLMNLQGEILVANLVPIAAELKLDLDAFQACLDSRATGPIVERASEQAGQLDVDSIPYLFIGTQRVSGAISYEQLDALIEVELRKAETNASQPTNVQIP